MDDIKSCLDAMNVIIGELLKFKIEITEINSLATKPMRRKMAKRT